MFAEQISTKDPSDTHISKQPTDQKLGILPSPRLFKSEENLATISCQEVNLTLFIAHQAYLLQNL